MGPVTWGAQLMASGLRHLQQEILLRKAVIQRNVELLTSKPAKSSADDVVHHGVASAHQEPTNSRLGCDGNDSVVPSATSVELGAIPTEPANPQGVRVSARERLELQLLQLLTSPQAFSEEDRRRLLLEVVELLSSSSVNDYPILHATPSRTRFHPAHLPLSASPLSSLPLNRPLRHEPQTQPDAAVNSSFEIGLLSERSILALEEEVTSGRRRDLVTGEFVAPLMSSTPTLIATEVDTPARKPLLDIEVVRRRLRRVMQVFDKLRRFGLPETSLENKLPWHYPRAPLLARGLQWPPEHFASEKERIEFNRRARMKRKFLLGTPPIWTVALANLAFIAVLVHNPAAL